MSTVTIDPGTTYQTWQGWEATAQAGQIDSPLFPQYASYLFDQAVNDLGIDRLRVEVFQLTGTSFDLSALDDTIVRVALPMKRLLQARGEDLWINVCVVGNGFRSNPSGYAQAVLGVYQHLQNTYGILPTSWEVILEPDTFTFGFGAAIGNPLVAAGNLLTANGYTNLHFLAPSDTNTFDAIADFDAFIGMAGVSTYLKTFSFHDYGYDTTSWGDIATRAAAHSLATAQLEHIGATHTELYGLLTIANISAFQQYTLAYPGTDGAGAYYFVTSGALPADQVHLSASAKFLRQYMRAIRRGAVRLKATSDDVTVKPVVFRNTNGQYAVIIETTAAATVDIVGLPAGTYGQSYTTGTGTGFYNQIQPDGVVT